MNDTMTAESSFVKASVAAEGHHHGLLDPAFGMDDDHVISDLEMSLDVEKFMDDCLQAEMSNGHGPVVDCEDDGAAAVDFEMNPNPSPLQNNDRMHPLGEEEGRCSPLLQEQHPMSATTQQHVAKMPGNDDDSEAEEQETDEYDEFEGEEYIKDANDPAFCDGDENVDAEIAKQLNSLSLQQRDKALYDIHGVADVIQETPELVTKCLTELELWLQKKKRKASFRKTDKATAYRLAESQSPDYVRRESFRLQFLRAKQFKVVQAGRAILFHFSVKQELFGDEKLTKDITMKDLDEDDMICLNNGHTQVLPLRDPAGRYVCISNVSHAKFREVSNVARSLFYMSMAFEDSFNKEAMDKGMVTIMYNVRARQVFDKRMPLVMRRVRAALPVRVSTLHMCTDRHFMSGSFLDWIRRYAMETTLQIRTLVHRGTQEECLEKLEKYGIPPHAIPLTKGGAIRRVRHQGWLENRRIIEEARESNGNVAVDKDLLDGAFVAPSQSDVLMGRGKASQTHIGNLRLRLMLEANMDRFDSGSTKRGEKMQLAKEMVDQVRATGGHFLKLEKGGMWTSVSDEEACKKVAHDFRTLRKKSKDADAGRDTDMKDPPAASKRVRSNCD